LRRSTGGYGWVEAAGKSMSPLIQPGDRLYVEFGSRRPRLGEIVVFADGARAVAHRLVRRVRTDEGELLIMRGDSTLGFDSPVSIADAFGVVRAYSRRDGAVVRVAAGPAAAAVAKMSLVAGYLLVRVERLPPGLPKKIGARAVRRLGPALVAGCVRAAAWSDRILESTRLKRRDDVAPESAGIPFPLVD
jgi:Peptidase S24-like